MINIDFLFLFWKYWFILILQFYKLVVLVDCGGFGATLNGETYIYNAFPKAYISWSSEILLIEFKTIQNDAILFYSGDFNEILSETEIRSLMIYFDNVGHIVYNITRSKVINDGNVIIIRTKNKYGGRFSDNQWHKISFIRSLNKAKSGFEMTINIKEDDTDLYLQRIPVTDLFEKTRFLYIGGVSKKLTKKSNFKGCLFKVIYKADNIQLDVLYLTQKRLHGFLEVGNPIIFSSVCQTSNENLGTISLLSSNSFVILKTRSDTYSSMDLSVEFSAQTDSFILYYHKSHDGGDYIAIEVRSNQLVIGLCYQRQETVWYVPNCFIQRNKIYLLRLVFDFGNGNLKINCDGADNEKNIAGSSTMFSDLTVSLSSEIHLGGGSYGLYAAKYFMPRIWMASLQRGFKGCLMRVKLNDEIFDLERSIESVFNKNNKVKKGCTFTSSSQENCQTKSQSRNLCQNGGSCRDDWPIITCNCDFTNFEGDKCDKENRVVVFNGSGFIRIDLGTELHTEAESIFIRFKTEYSSGFLFSTVPSEYSETIFQSMELFITDSVLSFNIQYRDQRLSFKLTANVSDNVWHSLIILRQHRSLSMNLDGNVLQQDLISNQSILSWQNINIGASLKWTDNYRVNPFSSKTWIIKTRLNSNRNVYQNFVGSIVKFKINNIDILNDYVIQYRHHQSLWNMNTETHLNPIRNSSLLFPIIFHTHSSYITISKVHLYDSFSLSLRIKTSQRSGVIFMVTGSSSDFLLLELLQGDLRLSFNMGSSVQNIEGNKGLYENLADGKWHVIELARRDMVRNVLSLHVDGKVIEELMIINSYKSKNFNLDKPAFVGGLASADFVRWNEKIISTFGFQGCISGFKINDKMAINLLQDPSVEIPDHFKTEISQGCDWNMTIVCSETYCKNGGHCLQQWHRRTCDCRYTTFQGERCTKMSTTLRFKRQADSNNYLLIKYKDRSRNTSREDIALGLKTTKSDGTILSIESRNRDSGDFMHLYLESGKIIFEYDMGAGLMKITDNILNVADGSYRRIRVRRSGSSTWLQIDHSLSELEKESSKAGKYFNEQMYIWVGSNPGRKDSKQFEGSISGLIINGIEVSRVLQNKGNYPDLQISSVGEVSLDIVSDYGSSENSNFILNEMEIEKTGNATTPTLSVCPSCLSTFDSNKVVSITNRLSSTTSIASKGHIPTLTMDRQKDNGDNGFGLLSRNFIIIFISVCCVTIIVSVTILCRCFRKRGDRGSYNLTKANKFNDVTPIFSKRASLELININQNPYSDKDYLELSPQSKCSKDDSDIFIFRPKVDDIVNGEGSIQSVATYIPNPKEQDRKKKEVKEWYV